MQNYEAAVMYMPKDFSDIRFLFPSVLDLDAFVAQSPEEPFSDHAISFLNVLSKELSANREYPEIAAFAFFCRRANVLALREKYTDDMSVRMGRGVVFHIAPSNVAINFAYSLVCGILSGNLNIVRVPSKDFEQIRIITAAIKKISNEAAYQSITNRIVLIRYDRQSTATAYFSSVCDVRIIWGGDKTIADIRKNPLPARSFDVTFADRYSICVINADRYITEAKQVAVATGFYNDTYLFDQNACTSPHLVVWMGTKQNVKKAKEDFWQALHEIVKARYGAIQPVMAVDKLTAFYKQSLQSGVFSKITTEDNLLWRIELSTLTDHIEEQRCAGGYFSEFHAKSLDEITPVINRTFQTLTYYGVDRDELIGFVKKNKLKGIDRIVPIGRASDFSTTWDGFELITTLSRKIDIIA